MRDRFITALGAAIVATSVSGCATVSKSECIAGDWEGIGFKDGENGRSRSRLADISKSCAKHGVVPDRVSYMRGLEQGLVRYCTLDRGYADGTRGAEQNAECVVRNFVDYGSAYAEGREVFATRTAYQNLIEQWQDTDTAIADIDAALVDDVLTEAERKRLRQKRRRLEVVADELRVDIRVFERDHGFPRWQPS